MSDFWFDQEALLKAFDQGGMDYLDQISTKIRSEAADAARDGDWTAIIDLLRRGSTLNKVERHLIADFLEGKLKATRGRPRNLEQTRKIAIANFWLAEVDGLKHEAAVANLMAEFGLARSTVLARLQEARSNQEIQTELGARRLAKEKSWDKSLSIFRDFDCKSE